MFMCLFVIFDFEVQESEIVFDTRKVRAMLAFLKVITGGSVFNQSAVDDNQFDFLTLPDSQVDCRLQ